MGSIVIKEAGNLVPDDFLNVLLKKYKHMGMIVYNDGTLETMQRSTPYKNLDEALEEINSVQVKLKEQPILLYFENYPDGMPADSAQPYILVYDAEEKNGETIVDPMIIGFIDGDMDDDLEPSGSNNTREYMAANRVATALDELYTSVGNDLEELMEKMDPDKNPGFKRTLVKDIFDDKGCIAFFTASGDVSTYTRNATGKDFDWGWASDSAGYGEAPAALPKSVVTAAKGVLTSITPKGVLSTIKAGAAAATAATPAKDSNAEEMVMARPPKHILTGSGNKKKSWYEHRVSIVPSNWKECPAIAMTRATAEKEGCTIITKPALPDGVHAVPAPKQPDAEPLPLIPDSQRDYIINDFLKDAKIAKLLDASSNSIPNPADMDAEMSKYPTFCEKAGLSGLEQTLRFPYSSLLKLAKNAPEAFTKLFVDLRMSYVNELKSKPAGVTKPDASVAETKPAAASPTPAPGGPSFNPRRSKRG